MLALLAPPARAALRVQSAADETLTIVPAAAIACATDAQSGPSVVRRLFSAPGTGAQAGTITARLSGSAAADYDVGIFRGASTTAASGSAAFGSTELASAIVDGGQEVTVQVCRRKGTASPVRLEVFFTTNDAARRATGTVQIAQVELRSRLDGLRLSRLGLDTADSPHGDHWDVYVDSAAERTKLRRAGLSYRITDRDVAATRRRNARIDRRRARSAATRALTPGGRTSYRTLPIFEQELKALTERYPSLVRPVTLQLPTWDGRQVVGVEIAENVGARDGRPTYIQVGTHHAREWPAPEATHEFGLELIKNFVRDPAYLVDRPYSDRLARIVREGRTLVIPVLNPDGYDVSRQYATLKRKNCRPYPSPTPSFQCLARALFGESDLGVDPNRGYGVEWGGPGTSSDVLSQNFTGPGPWSEPELEGFRRLLRDVQGTVLVTNHTYGGHLMRPPGTTRYAPLPDEPLMAPLGGAMAATLDYDNWYSYNLYNTTGSTSDYVYRGLGVFPFTPEIGRSSFAPSYTTGFVPEYNGSAPGLGGLREAFTLAGLAAIDPAQHSRIVGYAPSGRTLRITKRITYVTSDRPNDDGFSWPVQTITEPRTSTMVVPSGGRVDWHVSPSRQPLDSARTTWRLSCLDDAGREIDGRDVEVERSAVADIGAFCGAGIPQPGEIGSAGGPGTGPAGPQPPCAGPPAAFRFVGAQRRGRGVLLRFGRLFPEEVAVTITQLARGTKRLRRLKRPRVVRRLARQLSFVWSGRDRRGRRVPDGLYEVTFRMVEEADVRKLTLRKRDGRFSLVRTAAAQTCG